jgi:hypothetical protein
MMPNPNPPFNEVRAQEEAARMALILQHPGEEQALLLEAHKWFYKDKYGESGLGLDELTHDIADEYPRLVAACGTRETLEVREKDEPGVPQMRLFRRTVITRQLPTVHKLTSTALYHLNSLEAQAQTRGPEQANEPNQDLFR